MDPVSLVVAAIVQALARGALAGLSRSADDGVYAIAAVLRDRVLAKYSPVAPELASQLTRLEAEPTSPTVQAELEQTLQQAGAGDDADLDALAHRLMSIIEDPLAALDSIERAHHRAGEAALGRVLSEHVGGVLEVRSQYAVNDTDLLSTDISSCDVLPVSVRDQVAAIHDSVRGVVGKVAAAIEDQTYRAATNSIADMPLGALDRQRATRLISADKEIHVSYQTLRLTIGYFSKFNSDVIRRIDREMDSGSELQMVLGNAITIYELAAYVIRFVESFAVEGVGAIKELHKSTIDRIRESTEKHRALAGRLDDPGIDPDVVTGTREDIANRERALVELEEEWGRYLEEVGALHSAVGDLKAKIPTLEVIRDNAHLQIEVLQLVAMMRFLRENSNAIRSTIDALRDFRLAPLTPNRVRRLLGLR